MSRRRTTRRGEWWQTRSRRVFPGRPTPNYRLLIRAFDPEFFGCRLRARGSCPDVRYRYKIDIRGQSAHSLQPLYRLFYWGFSQLIGGIDVGANRNLRTEFGEYRNFSLTNYPGRKLPGKMINISLIPILSDQNPCAHWRNPMDMIRQGWSMSLFHASQQWSTRSS